MTDEKLPESRNRVSRRTVLKLTGAGAAIAWTTPIISSVRMPAFAASGCQEIFRDDFDAEPCGTPVPGLTNWAVTAGTVDVVGGACGWVSTGANDHVLDMDGSPGNAKIETNTTFPAGNYQVQFDLGGSQRGDAPNTIVVTFGNLSQSITLSSGDPIAPQGPFSATLAAPGKLVFDHTGNPNDNIGLLLDNVVISSCP